MGVKADRFPGYTPITDRIFLRNEPRSGSSSDTASGGGGGGVEQPTTIIIYGWGDGQPRHVAKYADGYHGLFPRARICVVLSSTLAVASHTLARRTRDMLPVVDTLFPSAAEARRRERVVVHVMSNTGGIFAAATLNAYRQRHGAGSQLPHHLCVSDSTPGSTAFSANVWRWARAMALGTAKWFPWPFAVTRSVYWAFLWAMHLLAMLLRIEPSGPYSVGVFLDHEMATTRAPRIYMYSKADDLIGWEDVEANAAVAKSKGYKIILERFEDSPHVGHMRLHPEQYWGAIARAWEESMKMGGNSKE
ncbi:DUF829-domain-containing protein [Xylariomycetidae sp. FL0641]|nr:DUF829-domain-containing protein [Xylariomycetidae sp. FL0641]